MAWGSLGLEEAVTLKRDFLNNYFDVIRDCDLVLIANSRKHGIDGYTVQTR